MHQGNNASVFFSCRKAVCSCGKQTKQIKLYIWCWIACTRKYPFWGECPQFCGVQVKIVGTNPMASGNVIFATMTTNLFSRGNLIHHAKTPKTSEDFVKGIFVGCFVCIHESGTQQLSQEASTSLNQFLSSIPFFVEWPFRSAETQMCSCVDLLLFDANIYKKLIHSWASNVLVDDHPVFSSHFLYDLSFSCMLATVAKNSLQQLFCDRNFKVSGNEAARTDQPAQRWPLHQGLGTDQTKDARLSDVGPMHERFIPDIGVGFLFHTEKGVTSLQILNWKLNWKKTRKKGV